MGGGQEVVVECATWVCGWRGGWGVHAQGQCELEGQCSECAPCARWACGSPRTCISLHSTSTISAAWLLSAEAKMPTCGRGREGWGRCRGMRRMNASWTQGLPAQAGLHRQPSVGGAAAGDHGDPSLRAHAPRPLGRRCHIPGTPGVAHSHQANAVVAGTLAMVPCRLRPGHSPAPQPGTGPVGHLPGQLSCRWS